MHVNILSLHLNSIHFMSSVRSLV